ncbi:MAG: murein biosynthesis integral membrane protein MurJ [Oscillospiraceae bacterium]|nr:murein biosynthesis integral membrane protein MurJ [Oscillospiraceae bacterium]
MSQTVARGFLRSTALVTAAAIITKFMGFIREITMAYVYGAGTVSDAFVAAFTLPGVVLSIAGSALAAAFIPVCYKIGEAEKHRFTSNVLNCLAIIGLLFTAVFAVFPQALAFLFASQFDAETLALASRFLRIIVLGSAPLLMLDVFRAHLQMQNAFFFASVISVVSNLTIIPAIPLSKSQDWPELMAVGVAAGYFLCCFALLARCRKHGLQYSLYLNPRDEGMRHLIRTMMPVFLAIGIAEINQVVDRNFASWLPSGAMTCLNFAARLSSLITMVIGASLVTVLFPRMSERASGGDTDSVRRYLSESIRKLFPVLLPVTVGAILLAGPIIRLLFQRGEFGGEDAARTAEALQMYALAFFFNSANPLLVRAFYALRSTKTPALCSAVSVASGIGMNFLLIGPLEHRGLALSTSLAAVVSCLLLNLNMRRRLGKLGLLADMPEHIKTLAAAALMGGTVWLALRFVPVMEAGSTLMCAVYTAGLILLGAAVYAVCHAVLRTRFFGDVMNLLKGMRKRSAGA